MKFFRDEPLRRIVYALNEALELTTRILVQNYESVGRQGEASARTELLRQLPLNVKMEPIWNDCTDFEVTSAMTSDAPGHVDEVRASESHEQGVNDDMPMSYIDMMVLH